MVKNWLELLAPNHTARGVGNSESLTAGTSPAYRLGWGWALERDQNCNTVHTCAVAGSATQQWGDYPTAQLWRGSALPFARFNALRVSAKANEVRACRERTWTSPQHAWTPPRRAHV